MLWEISCSTLGEDDEDDEDDEEDNEDDSDDDDSEGGDQTDEDEDEEGEDDYGYASAWPTTSRLFMVRTLFLADEIWK